MPPATKKVFIIGPDFIGREVIDRLFENNYSITILIRRLKAADELYNDGVTTIIGTIYDASL
jgi:nucleoside-diphosphate-sugar epimerase